MRPFKLEWQTEHRKYSLDLGSETLIMGILNTTPDSFSDGGQYFQFNDAVEQGLKLVDEGADILDIGGESSRPFAEPVSIQEELDRTIPVIEHLSNQIDIPISIDTVKFEVAKEAINAGASIINDITALEKDERMAQLASDKGVPVILMHMKGSPATMQINPQYDDFLNEIISYLKDRANFAINSGISPKNIILDPGIGFGKTVEHNLMIIKYLDKIGGLGFPTLVGPSRKSFIQKILASKLNQIKSSSNGNKLTLDDKTLNTKNTNPLSKGKMLNTQIIKALSKETEAGTMGAVAASIMSGANIVRVHDVASAKAVATIINAVYSVKAID
ncbi:MAG: dihydropteroate synthase [Desulfamplus sp.]|nr:dihydropteroate synthase [Desulfamplus sp.]